VYTNQKSASTGTPLCFSVRLLVNARDHLIATGVDEFLGGRMKPVEVLGPVGDDLQ
jgi:hypothetical protein